MDDNLRNKYIEFLHAHGLKPRTIPKNAEQIRQAMHNFMIQDAKASGDEFWVELEEKAFNNNQEKYRTLHPAEILITAANKAVERSLLNLKKYQQSFRSNVFAGEFPTGSINAQAVQVEGGFLVLINSGTMVMLQQVVNFLSQGDPDKPSSDDANISAVDGVTAVLAAYLRHGDPFFGPKPISGGMKSLFTYAFSSACEQFVLAHEYGHILAGHFDDAVLHLERFDTEAGTIDVIKKDWKQELEADTIGYKIILGVEEYSQLDVSVIDQAFLETELRTTIMAEALKMKCAIAAPFLFLTIDAILDQVNKTVREKSGLTNVDSLHPPAKMRIDNILPALEGLEKQHSGFVNFPGILIKSFDAICTKIIEEIMRHS